MNIIQYFLLYNYYIFKYILIVLSENAFLF